MASANENNGEIMWRNGGEMAYWQHRRRNVMANINDNGES